MEPLDWRAQREGGVDVIEVGAIAELEESTENFVVPVNVGYAFQEQWMIRKQAPVLKTLSMSMLLDF